MADASWNPWKITAIGMALVMATALVTGLVVANWTAPNTVDRPPTAETRATSDSQPPAAPSRPAAAPAKPRVAQTAQPRVPTQAVIDECNRQAAKATTKDKTIEVVKDAAIGAAIGAAVGAAGGAIADGGKGAGKGAAIGGVVGAGGGTLYGLNENRKGDERSREAYGACMRSRGYAN